MYEHSLAYKCMRKHCKRTLKAIKSDIYLNYSESGWILSWFYFLYVFMDFYYLFSGSETEHVSIMKQNRGKQNDTTQSISKSL